MSSPVRPKKALGQHFLADSRIALKVSSCLQEMDSSVYVLEIGPGTGMLSRFLMEQHPETWYGMEVDAESVAFMQKRYPQYHEHIIHGDFLTYDLHKLFGDEEFVVVGNFPYNISSQIVFRVLDHRSQVPGLTGMFQKEVAQRIASPPGSRVYGILSVLCQAFYDVRICFHIPPGVFIPPPKVMSSVLQMTRKASFTLSCNEKLFFAVVKTAFNQRRKTLRNSLKSINVNWEKLPGHLAGERPEQLSVDDFVQITHAVQ